MRIHTIVGHAGFNVRNSSFAELNEQAITNPNPNDPRMNWAVDEQTLKVRVEGRETYEVTVTRGGEGLFIASVGRKNRQFLLYLFSDGTGREEEEQTLREWKEAEAESGLPPTVWLAEVRPAEWQGPISVALLAPPGTDARERVRAMAEISGVLSRSFLRWRREQAASQN